MDAIQTELFSLLITIIVACIGIVTKHVVTYLKEEGFLTKLEKNKQIVKVIVQAVEQIYKTVDGNGKLRIAKKEITQIMQSKKINITDKEIELLIESVIKEIKSTIKNNK